MPINIVPGRYIIVPHGAQDDRVVGMSPLLHAGSGESLAQGKPVEVVFNNLPDYTRIWEVAKDGTLSLSYMGRGLSALGEDHLVFLGSPAEKWTIETHGLPEGRYQTINNKGGLYWNLSNPDEGQPELTPMVAVWPPRPPFLFQFKGPILD